MRRALSGLANACRAVGVVSDYQGVRMEHLFDGLSKQMARSISRRRAFGVLVRGILGTFASSVGFSRSWNQPNFRSSGFCSSCGTCHTLNASTGVLQTCGTKCKAQMLCNTAEQYVPFATLQTDLGSRYYTFNRYDALLYVNGSAQTNVFHASYALPNDTSYTADLYMIQGSSGKQAYYVESVGGTPQYAYQVSVNGSIQQILPPPPINSQEALKEAPILTRRCCCQCFHRRADRLFSAPSESRRFGPVWLGASSRPANRFRG